jgi:hypothetical protein
MQERGRLGEDQALKIVRDIAGALECAHQNGMVHRDVKPDNILINKNGTAKLADLGLARHQNDDAHLTQSGQALGTPFYMAPEQVRGEIDNLDTRADLYALGATLFHFVTGQPPYQGETSAVIMAKHLSDPPPMANRICADVSSGCSKLILKLMQKDKAQRLQTPHELIEQVDRLLKLPAAARGLTTGPRVPVKGAATTAPRDAVRPRLEQEPPAAPAPKKSPAFYAGVGAGVVLLLGLAGMLLMSSDKPSQSRKSDPKPVSTVQEQPVLATGDAKTTPEKVEVPPDVPKESPLERHWREAKAFATAQPNAFDEILRRYNHLSPTAVGTPLEAEIQVEIADVERKLAAAAKEALAALEKQIGEAVAIGDYDAALAASSALPPALSRTLAEQLEAKRHALREEAEGKIRPVLEKATAASGDADPAAGLRALETIAALKFQPLAEERQNLKERLDGELANVDELRARKAKLDAEKRLAELLGRFDHALLEFKDESAASRVAKEAKGASDLDPVREQANALSAILEAATTERKRQDEAMASLKGRPFAVGKDTGAIERVADGLVYVKISFEKMSATKTVKIADLTPEQKAELFPPLKEIPPALQISDALQKLIRGQEDLAAATQLLNAVPDFPLTPHYLELIQSRKAAVMETEAQKAWTELTDAAAKPLQKPEDALPVFEKLTAFFNAYGQTKFALEHADEMTALRNKLEQIANPNFVKNGAFETGKLDGWDVVVDKPENAQLVSDIAHGGKSCMRLARGSISQSVRLTPGQTYEASCWVKRSEYMGAVLFNIDDSRDPGMSKHNALAELNEWTRWSIVFTAQKPEHKISVALIGPPAAIGSVYVDEITVGKPNASTASSKATIPPDAIRFGGNAYKSFPTPLGAREAQQRCQEMGGHLLVVNTEAEQEFVLKAFATLNQQLWVGLVKRGEEWTWVTGEPIQVNHWVTGRPDEGTAARMMPVTGKWNAGNEARPLGFICEWDAGSNDPKQPSTPVVQTPAAAQFMGEDPKTQGNWKKFFGKDGYAIQGDETKSPAYAQFACNGIPYVWERQTDEPRALDRVQRGKVAACWYSQDKPMLCDVKLTDGREHTLAVYLMDWRERGASTLVEILDAGSGKVLDSRVVSAYGQGKYIAWRLKGNVQIRFTVQGGKYAFISGVFFQ